jgi:surface polysaccharide O-acyltransferase-like enzyme
MIISRKLSDSLRIANIMCTLLVIAIHYNTKHDMDLSSGFTWNYYLQEFITNGLARVAVPFFAFIAGLFFFLSYKNLSSYPKAIKKRINSLLIPYLVASFLIFIVEYVYGVIQWDLSLENFDLFIRDVLFTPISVQFWFLRDLMILVLLTPIIFKLVSQLELWIMVPVMVLWLLDIEIMPLFAGRHVITIETLSFFILGCYFSQHTYLLEKLVNGMKNKTVFTVVIIYLMLCVIRIVIEPDMANWYTNKYQINSLIIQNMSIFIGVFLIIALSTKIINAKLLYLSQFTFFVYIFHLLPLSHLVGKITSYIISDAYKFYLTFPVAVILVFISAVFCKKLMPRLYSVFSGGR